MNSTRRYQPDLRMADGGLQQSFHANYVVAEDDRHGGKMLAFGDLFGDASLGSQRTPIHSLILSAMPRNHATCWDLVVEFNDQGNTISEAGLERVQLARNEVTLWCRPDCAVLSGRVSLDRTIDPYDAEIDPVAERIRTLRVTFDCDDATFAALRDALERVDVVMRLETPSPTKAVASS